MIYKPLFLVLVLCVDTHNSRHMFFTFTHVDWGSIFYFIVLRVQRWWHEGGWVDMIEEATWMNNFGDGICYENCSLVCGTGLWAMIDPIYFHFHNLSTTVPTREASQHVLQLCGSGSCCLSAFCREKHTLWASASMCLANAFLLAFVLTWICSPWGNLCDTTFLAHIWLSEYTAENTISKLIKWFITEITVIYWAPVKC